MTEENFWEEYNQYREKMNKRVMETDNLNIKRFFNLDTRAYDSGALDKKTKEMLGLVASLVLKCDDCINYHLQELYKLNITDEELYEVLNIGLIVGGSIIIPHLRKALEAWDKLNQRDG
ncbi:MAG: carboxymuconolactone decarboxylase family protein [Bacillota bacterium]